MNRSRFPISMSRRPAVFAAIAAAGLTLAACGTNSASSSGSGTTSSSAASGKAASSASANSGTSGNGAVTGSTMFPAAIGNTWVYDDTVGAEKGTVTNRITAIAPTAGGQQVTMTNSDDLPGLGAAATKTTTETLIFHSDGSISIPLTQLGSTAVTVKSGSILWPSASGLAAGQSRTSTIVMTVTVAGHATTVTLHVLVKSGGSATVTVPAGTYQTTLINETMTEQLEGMALNIKIQNWDASGVGPVKTDAISTAEGHTTTVSNQELKSFTKG